MVLPYSGVRADSLPSPDRLLSTRRLTTACSRPRIGVLLIVAPGAFEVVYAWDAGRRAGETKMKADTGERWELLAALGAACWIENLVTLEWAYPYCSIRDDGPAAAIHGFPLPYEQASIVTSATDFFIPWLYVVNLAAIAGGLFLLLRFAASRLGTSHARLRKLVFGVAGTFLLVTAVALEVFGLSIGVFRPTSSFDGRPLYSELRPVAVRVLRRSTECTPSPFWFPDKGARSTGQSQP